MQIKKVKLALSVILGDNHIATYTLAQQEKEANLSPSWSIPYISTLRDHHKDSIIKIVATKHWMNISLVVTDTVYDVIRVTTSPKSK